MGTPSRLSDRGAQAGSRPDQLLDLSVLRTYCRGDDDLVCDILDEFVPAERGSVGALQLAVASRDAVEVRASAHRVKSAALMVGGTRLADVARTIEIAAEQGAMDRAVQTAAVVGEVMDLTEQAIVATVARLRAGVREASD